MARAPNLTDETKTRIVEAAQKDGLSGRQLAKRFGVNKTSVFRLLQQSGLSRPRGGRPKNGTNGHGSRAIAALNRDILNGASDHALREHEVVRNGHGGARAKREVPQMTPEQIQRLLAMLGRLAEKRPDVFSRLRIMQRLAQHPDVLLEVM